MQRQFIIAHPVLSGYSHDISLAIFMPGYHKLCKNLLINNMLIPVTNYLEYYTPGSEGTGFIILVHCKAGNFTFTNWSTWDTILIMKANEMNSFSNFLVKYSTCFGHVHSPSSGISQHCVQAIGICHASSVGVC